MTKKHLNTNFRERIPKPTEPWSKREENEDGPKRPDVDKPDTRDLLRRMRRVDPNQSRRYRQRTGE